MHVDLFLTFAAKQPSGVAVLLRFLGRSRKTMWHMWHYNLQHNSVVLSRASPLERRIISGTQTACAHVFSLHGYFAMGQMYTCNYTYSILILPLSAAC